MCLTAHIDPGPLGRFAPVADTQGFAPRPLLLIADAERHFTFVRASLIFRFFWNGPTGRGRPWRPAGEPLRGFSGRWEG